MLVYALLFDNTVNIPSVTPLPKNLLETKKEKKQRNALYTLDIGIWLVYFISAVHNMTLITNKSLFFFFHGNTSISGWLNEHAQSLIIPFVRHFYE